MPLPIFDRPVVDAAGNLKPFATVQVTRESDGTGVTLYADRDAGTVEAAGGLYTVGSNGLARFYLPPGLYRMVVSAGGSSTTYPYQKIDDLNAIIAESGTSRTCTVVDLGNVIEFSNGSAINYEIDDDVFDIDNIVYLRQSGAGQITIVPGTGVSVEPPSGGTLITHGEGATVGLKKVAASSYILIGHTEISS